MSKRFEGSFRAYDRAEIFYQGWKPETTRGTIVVTHGLAEHSECYHEFAQQLTPQGWQVLAWDLRGHGHSEGKRGYVAGFDHFCSDFASFVQLVRSELHTKGQPIVAFGHSMGGLITVKSVLLHKDIVFNALALSSPAFGLAIKVPALKEKIAVTAAKWLPKITMWNEIHYDDLVQDEAKIKAYASDPLRHDKISPPVFVGMLEGFEYCLSRAHEVTLPLIMQISGIDRIVDPQAALKFYDQVGSPEKKLFVYNDSLHEIFNDIHNDKAFKDLRNFLSPLLG